MAARKAPAKSAARTVKATPTENKTITIRKITNGYIVRESSYNERTHRFNEKETFSNKPPQFTPGG